jgi:hypothetical protein
MKDSQIRRAWQFVVTHQVQCPKCKVLMPEAQVTKHKTWISYQIGWLEQESCQPCFEKERERLKGEVKPVDWSEML